MIYPRESPQSLGFEAGLLQTHLYFDNMTDFPNLPGLNRVAPGSDAMCIDTGDVYILRGDTGKWEVL